MRRRGLGWTLACALLASLALSACGSGGLGAAGDFSPRVAGTLTVATAQIPDPGLWAGTAAHPSGGFEYGLARALAARFGLARVKVKLVPFSQLVAGNLAGADVALSDITVTSEREQKVDFSAPYLKAPPAILVRPGTEVPDVYAARKLHFAVQQGTTLEQDLNGAIEPLQMPTVLHHQREVLLALRIGRANAAMLRPAGGARLRPGSAQDLRSRSAAAERRRARGGAAEGLGQRAGGRLGDPRIHRRRHDREPRQTLAGHRHQRRSGRNHPGSEDRTAVSALHASFGALVELSTPKGAPWEFLVLFATVLLGPVILARARAPGIIGLLLGGYAVGPHGLGLISSGNSTVPDLGQLGLLYLMFVAGVELDLNLLRRYRRSALIFGLMTFALPMLFGTSVGVALGWETAAAILLGSLLASHTLITYPTVRDAGLASDPAVATVVGSTVLTDTLTLVVLAAVAGSVGGGRSAFDVGVQLVVGLSVLIAFSLIVLPVLARAAFRSLGAERAVRYVVAITAFLSAATVAELFGIEGIVGAFFAGLAMNRLVPNEGQLMDRISFFGGAVFIPVFLVSVGFILNAEVMVQANTLALAGLFTIACLGGKLIAAALSARVLSFSRPQAELLFSLSSAQAAATLAATVVGFQLGLFDSSVVNAILVVIFVSVLVSTLAATHATSLLHGGERGEEPLGARVVVGVGDPARARAALTVAVRIARADGGVVMPVLVVPESGPIAPKAARELLLKLVAEAGVDGLLTTVVDRNLIDGAMRAGAACEATLVLVADGGDADVEHPELLALAGAHASERSQFTPVALVRGDAESLGVVRTLLGADDGEQCVAAEMARRVAGGVASPLEGTGREHDWSETLAPGDVTFISGHVGEALSALSTLGQGVFVRTLVES